MDIFDRIGAKGEKINFEIEFHYIEIEVPHETHVKIEWKSSKKTCSTVHQIIPDSLHAKVDIEETLTNTHMIYTKKHSTVDKKIELKVLKENKGKTEEIGKVVLNLSRCLEAPEIGKIYKVKKCKDKNAQICLSVKAQNIGSSTLSSTLAGSIIENEIMENQSTEALVSEGILNRIKDIEYQIEDSEATLNEILKENKKLREQIDEKEKLTEKIKKAKEKKNTIKEKREKMQNEIDEMNESLSKLKSEKEDKRIEMKKESGLKKNYLINKISELKEIKRKLKSEDINNETSSILEKEIQSLVNKINYSTAEIERFKNLLEPAELARERDPVEEMILDNMRSLRQITKRYSAQGSC
ncbi:unnamed protein product [Blepharisma stoltei]|uniref:C2 NT-type domain-containing protein n=1 Tax=Blepharisma stoltei TaxID=1481888 RepID=A0AAU9JP05_9CILI|nr:unnamed protein product [Blepharisma stoltei]